MLSYPLQELVDRKGKCHCRFKILGMSLPGLLCIMLLIVMGRPCAVWGGDVDNRAAVSAIVHTDSLEQAWVEAISSAHRLKASHKSVEAAFETVSAAKSKHFPTVIAEGGHFWLDEAPSASISFNAR